MNQTKKIQTYDLFDNNHYVNPQDLEFRISVYGVLIEDERVLLQRHPSSHQWGLPGGGIEKGERIPVALNREFEEETGISVKIEKLLDVDQSFFTFENDHFHGVLLFYEVRRTSGTLLKNGNNIDTNKAEYKAVSELNELPLQQAFRALLGNFINMSGDPNRSIE